MHDAVHATPPPTPGGMDQDTLAFFQAVFDLVRAGDAAQLAPLLERGLSANLRNQKGDSLLMLASYHGHLNAARLLLGHGADPEVCNDQGQSPLLGAAFKGNAAMGSGCCWRAARRLRARDRGAGRP